MGKCYVLFVICCNDGECNVSTSNNTAFALEQRRTLERSSKVAQKRCHLGSGIYGANRYNLNFCFCLGDIGSSSDCFKTTRSFSNGVVLINKNVDCSDLGCRLD